MSRATVEALGELHGKLADTLSKQLEKDDVSASLIKEAREFLKDNGIEAVAGKSEKMLKLVQHIPFEGDAEAAAG
jgi:hypothetical protein